MLPQTYGNILGEEWADVVTSGSACISMNPWSSVPNRQYRYDPRPVPRPVPHRCSHCGSNWREDSRGNCKSCGAPE